MNFHSYGELDYQICKSVFHYFMTFLHRKKKRGPKLFGGRKEEL